MFWIGIRRPVVMRSRREQNSQVSDPGSQLEYIARNPGGDRIRHPAVETFCSGHRHQHVRSWISMGGAEQPAAQDTAECIQRIAGADLLSLIRRASTIRYRHFDKSSVAFCE